MNFGEVASIIKEMMEDYQKKAKSQKKVESIADMKVCNKIAPTIYRVFHESFIKWVYWKLLIHIHPAKLYKLLERASTTANKVLYLVLMEISFFLVLHLVPSQMKR